jgi:hypothetical protein
MTHDRNSLPDSQPDPQPDPQPDSAELLLRLSLRHPNVLAGLGQLRIMGLLSNYQFDQLRQDVMDWRSVQPTEFEGWDSEGDESWQTRRAQDRSIGAEAVAPTSIDPWVEDEERPERTVETTAEMINAMAASTPAVSKPVASNQVASKQAASIAGQAKVNPAAGGLLADVQQRFNSSRRAIGSRAIGSGQSITESLMAELSLRWLLFLGLFLVVVSSAVLAASQWSQLDRIGQYLLLLLYTLAFAAAALWSDRQEALPLTASTLRWMSLLLVPVNFWAMDGLGLAQSPLGLVAMAIGSVALGFWVWQQSPPSRLRGLLLGLGLLHWGWASLGPLPGIYAGTIATAAIAPLGLARSRSISPQASEAPRLNLWNFLPVYGVMILMLRALAVNQLPLGTLGLAIAIGGQILARMLRSQLGFQSAWEWLSGSLILLGWLVSSWDYPAQGLAISAIGIWFLLERVGQFWQLRDWVGSVAIALQGLFQAQRVVPSAIGQMIQQGLVGVFGAQAHPWALQSLSLLPYVGGLALVAGWFVGQGHGDLADGSELIGLGLGLIGIALAIVNPALRTLQLGLTTAAIGASSLRRDESPEMPNRPNRPNRTGAILPWLRPRIYLTHVGLWATLLSLLVWVVPSSDGFGGATLLWGGGLAEWAGSAWRGRRVERLGRRSRLWLETAWPLGLGLVCLGWLGYAKLPDRPLGAWLWLMVPVGLIGLAGLADGRGALAQGAAGRTPGAAETNALQSYGDGADRTRWQLSPRTYGLLGTGAIGAWLILALPNTVSLVAGGVPRGVDALAPAGALAIAAGLMAINTIWLAQPIAAALAIGYGLAGWGVAIGQGFLKGVPFLLILAVTALGLKLLGLGCDRLALSPTQSNSRPNFRPRVQAVGSAFGQAFGGWTMVVVFVTLLLLTIAKVATPWIDQAEVTQVPATIGLLTIPLLFQPWRSKPTDLALYGLAWLIELALVQWVMPLGAYQLVLGHMGVALLVQLLGDHWRNNAPIARGLRSLHVIPLGFGLLGGLHRSQQLNGWTGLSTLSLAITLIGVGRRMQVLSPIRYLGIFGISVACYELFGFWLLQYPWINRDVGFAAIGSLILLVYSLLSHWLARYFRLLPIRRWRMLLHSHWALASGFLAIAFADSWDLLGPEPELLAGVMATPVPGPIAWLIGIALGAYALLQGRDRRREDQSIGEVWVGLGQLELLMVLAHGVSQLPGPLLAVVQTWGLVLASIVSFGLYLCPWRDWGWSVRPWRWATIALPLVVSLALWQQAPLLTLLFPAIGYLFLARLTGEVRLSYFAVLLVEVLLFRWFDQVRWMGVIQQAVMVGFVPLYVAQLDPSLRNPDRREQRHLIRMFGAALICGAPLLPVQGSALLAALFGLVMLSIGLALRIRAFLYVGTIGFLWTVVYQLIVLIGQQSFLKWVVGAATGVVLIVIAANFETRREQIKALTQDRFGEFESWD